MRGTLGGCATRIDARTRLHQGSSIRAVMQLRCGLGFCRITRIKMSPAATLHADSASRGAPRRRALSASVARTHRACGAALALGRGAVSGSATLSARVARAVVSCGLGFGLRSSEAARFGGCFSDSVRRSGRDGADGAASTRKSGGLRARESDAVPHRHRRGGRSGTA